MVKTKSEKIKYELREISTGKSHYFRHAVDMKDALMAMDENGNPRFESLDGTNKKRRPFDLPQKSIVIENENSDSGKNEENAGNESGDNGADKESDISKMRREELLGLAEQMGISNLKLSMKKQEIIEAIKESGKG